MLQITKNISLNGTSSIDGVQVAYMNASINTEGSSGININKNILDYELYGANKAAVRADIAEFEQEVYAIEDELLAQTMTLEE